VATLQSDDHCAAAAYAECLRLSHAVARVDLALLLEGLPQGVARRAANWRGRRVCSARRGCAGWLELRRHAAAWAEGEALPPEQAIGLALAAGPAVTAPRGTSNARLILKDDVRSADTAKRCRGVDATQQHALTA
jgi:hypothetical protein